MKVGFIVTAYNRIDDLLAHLEILRYFPYEHEVIPIWMKEDSPEYFLDELKSYPLSHYVNGISFRIGPLLALVSGIKKAYEAKIDYVVYRNGDDWLFNHEFCYDNFKLLEEEGKHIAAYNWLTKNTYTEFAMNEMYLRVSEFMETIEEAEDYFKNSSNSLLCELKMGRWIKRTLKHNFNYFYRLPDREMYPGVGYEIETLPEVFAMMGKMPPDGYLKDLEDNSRFFNKKWQLIGCHNLFQRYHFYAKIRNDIPYAASLEQEKHFNRWLKCFGEGCKWNLPSLKTEEIKRKKPFIIKQLPKKMPKRFIKNGNR